MRTLLSIPLAFLLLSACPTGDDDDTTQPPPDDDDDSAVVVDDDDDSTIVDDDDSSVVEPDPWAGPDDAFASFAGGGRDLGAVIVGGFDLDGDGLPGVAFGTPLDVDEVKVDPDRGSVYVFFGSTIAAGGAFDMADADVLIRGAAAEDKLGAALDAGDIDGDGADDLAIASETRPTTWIFFGPTLAAAVDGELLLSDADIVIGEQVAECIRFLGDIDADGGSELSISNTLNSTTGNVAGRTFVLSSQTVGVGGSFTVNQSWVDFPGGSAGQASGCETGPVGDVDGDLLPDLVVGTQGNGQGGANAGKASLFLAASLNASGGGSLALSTADATFIGESADDRLASDVRSYGDVDGDGFEDFLLGSRQNDQSFPDAGKTYLIRGGSLVFGGELYDVSGATAFLGEAQGDRSGTSMVGLGDVDGDGLPDLAIGAPRNDAAGDAAGSVHVVLGTLTSVPALPLGSASGVIRGNAEGIRFGEKVAAAGDVDGDGLDDLLVGAPRAGADPPGDRGPGAAWLLVSPYPDPE